MRLKVISLLIGMSFLAACSHSTSPSVESHSYLGMWYQHTAFPDTLDFTGATQCTLTGSIEYTARGAIEGRNPIHPSVQISTNDTIPISALTKAPDGATLINMSWLTGDTTLQGTPEYDYIYLFLNLRGDSLFHQSYEAGRFGVDTAVFTR